MESDKFLLYLNPYAINFSPQKYPNYPLVCIGRLYSHTYGMKSMDVK